MINGNFSDTVDEYAEHTLLLEGSLCESDCFPYENIPPPIDFDTIERYWQYKESWGDLGKVPEEGEDIII